MEEGNFSIAEDILLLAMNLQNYCEKTKDKNFNKQAFSIKFKILLLIKKYGNISPSTLVENLNIAKSNIAIFCKNLLKENFIAYKHDDFDRRIIYYCLTPKGEEYVSSLVSSLDKHLSLNFEEKQQKNMLKNIKSLNNNLTKIGVKQNVKSI